jgi:tetratricopeptide (TPR) repeat protein
MKRLFFVAVLFGALILSGILGFSYLKLKNKTPQAYFESGKSNYDQGNFANADIDFLNAIKRDGNHRDSRYYLALSYLAQKDLPAGAQQLKALLNIYPDDIPANLELGNLYVSAASGRTNYFQLAKEQAQKVLAKEPQNVGALVLDGNASSGLKDYSTSVESLQKAIALDPKNIPAWISLGATWTQQKNFPEAEKAFLKAREVDPKGTGGIISLANFYRAAGNPEKAQTVFNEALAQHPAEREIYSQVVDTYVENRKFDDAERVLKSAQAANGDDPAPTLDLAEIYKRQKRTEDERKILLDAKSKYPKSIPVAIKLASNLMVDKPDLARKEIDQILKEDPKNPAGQVLLGELQFSKGEFDAAAETLGKEPAVTSSFPQVHYLLGNMILKKGNVDEAQAHFQQALEKERNYIPARVALVNGYITKGQLSEARAANRQLLEADPSNVSGNLMRAVIDANDKKTESVAESEFSSLATQYPNNPDVQRQLGLYQTTRGKYAAAEKSFLRALELAPSEQSFRDLTLFYLLSKQSERAMQKLNAVPEAQRQSFHYELIGIVAEQNRKFPESEAAYKKALEKEPNRLSTESQLFNQYLRTGRLDDAQHLLDGVATSMPSNAVVPAMKGAVAELQGDPKAAEENYRKALQINSTIDFAANNLAYLLVQDGRDLQFAQSLAEGVRKRQPQNPAAADTLAWAYYKQELFVLGRDQAQFAVSQQPDNGVFQYHLGEIYKKTSENAKAIGALKKAVASPIKFKEKDLAEASLKDLLNAPAKH